MNTAPPKCRRVLVVEDDESTRRVMATLLRMHGAEVQTASTASEAIDKLAWKPDCLVLDLLLRHGNGREVLQEVRERALPIRVIVVTGSVELSEPELVRQLSPDHLLHKPVTFDAMLRCLDGDQPSRGAGE